MHLRWNQSETCTGGNWLLKQHISLNQPSIKKFCAEMLLKWSKRKKKKLCVRNCNTIRLKETTWAWWTRLNASDNLSITHVMFLALQNAIKRNTFHWIGFFSHRDGLLIRQIEKSLMMPWRPFNDIAQCSERFLPNVNWFVKKKLKA